MTVKKQDTSMKYVYGLVITMFIVSCMPEPEYRDSLYKSDFMHRSVKKLTDIMVYDAVNLQDDNFIEIASFWDCNPFVSHHRGHVMFGTKKISPGGHWMGITALAAKKLNLPPMETIEAYTWVSIGLFDSFISCWDEKYRSNLIRPETYINRYIDPMWRPLLQTPPFPEHTSGHSVVSRTSAVVLTALFGPDFAFDDTVEKEFGLPVRHFDSFLQASEEAAISRMYGGIHYMPAITGGVDQGEQVGEFIVNNLTLKK